MPVRPDPARILPFVCLSCASQRAHTLMQTFLNANIRPSLSIAPPNTTDTIARVERNLIEFVECSVEDCTALTPDPEMYGGNIQSEGGGYGFSNPARQLICRRHFRLIPHHIASVHGGDVVAGQAIDQAINNFLDLVVTNATPAAIRRAFWERLKNMVDGNIVQGKPSPYTVACWIGVRAQFCSSTGRFASLGLARHLFLHRLKRFTGRKNDRLRLMGYLHEELAVGTV